MFASIKKIFGKSTLIRRFYEGTLFVSGIAKNDLLNLKRAVLFMRVMPYTMVGYKRIRNVYDLSSNMVKNGVQGVFVECGVWKGGVAGVMGQVAENEGKGRLTWLFDSFEGLPEPTERDGVVAIEYSHERSSGKLQSIEECVGPLEDVEKLFFSVLKIPREYVKVEKGWFQDTIPHAKTKVGEIAILRLDADWYESTKYVLEQLYDQVISGGYVIIDDYGHWEGCKKAVDEFMQLRGITAPLESIDYTGVYFKKP